MDLRELRYFESTYELESISAAAKHCFVSQPSISAAIQNLEYFLGEQLFVRHTRGVTPTDAGHRLYPLSKQLTGQARSIKQLFQQKSAIQPFRLGVVPALGAARMSHLMKEIIDSVDGLELTLVDAEKIACEARIISSNMVKPGEIFNYEFTVEQSGTFMYHSGHMQALQVGMGMGGFFIAHPKEDPDPVDVDVPMMLQIWSLPPYSQIPDTMSMNFNWFTINGKVAPFVPHIKAVSGQKIRVRIANLSMMSHPIHLHGHTFKIVETGAGRNPESAHLKANTLSINAGETRTIEFEASKWPGPWLFHCHFMHHIMNDMDMPPIPGEMSPMMSEEGMFTIVDVVEK